MIPLRLLPAVLAILILAAHFYRAANYGLVAVCGAAPLLLFLRRRWVIYVTQVLLLFGGFIWLNTIHNFVQIRESMGLPSTRMAIILGGVALFTAGAALIFSSQRVKSFYREHASSAIPSAAAFLLTALTLSIAQAKVSFPILLIDRFIPGAGWLEILGLSFYAALITEKMLDINQSSLWRRRIWILFSVVFFSQLILGLVGLEKFLMTGKLHLPIPAIIVAGPIFRGEGFFMLILFAVTVILVGPAWCSHLCYIGAWDNLASLGRKKPGKMPLWRHPARLTITALILFIALALRIAGVPTVIATILGLVFGLAGVGLMVFWSRNAGVMTHCVTYCPIGPIANLAGKLSPFRIRINDSTCTDCGICHTACRFDALNIIDIKNRRPNFACTLCGDCLGSCRDGSLSYRFLGLSAENARRLFIVMIVSLHAVFMGVARI